MDNNDIYSELLNVSDKQNYTIDVVKRNADVLETIKDMVSVQPEPPVVVVPDTVVIENLPDVQKVEVLNPTEQVDLTSVENLLAQLVELVPQIKDDSNTEAVDKLTKLLAEDQSRDKVVELLRAILDKEEKSFEIPAELLSKDGRIKVEVDRAGGGGGGSASAAKQDEMIAAINNISGTGVYSKFIDDITPLMYVGEAVPGTATSAASWRIQLVDFTNNPDIIVKWAGSGFTNVWDDRASLTYI